MLLFSPLRDRDPASGDISYTENLLASPPPGVSYTTYAAALASGTLVVRGTRRSPGARDRVLLAARGLEVIGRRARLLYREPIWFVSVRPDSFDLIHQHLFAVAQVGSRLPVLSSAGYPLDVRYREHDGWSAPRTALATRLESGMARLAKVHNPWLHHVQPAISSGYTEPFRQSLVRRGAPVAETRVLGTFLATEQLADSVSDGSTLTFLGRDFNRKGGPMALAAFRRMRSRDESLRFCIITTAQHAASLAPEHGVTVYADLPPVDVLQLLRRTDVLLAPTTSDCGAPYGVLEALRAGCNVVLSHSQWLDERLAPPAVSRVQCTVGDVALAASETLQVRRQNRQAAALGARQAWREHFAEDAFHAELMSAYQATLAGSCADDRDLQA